jgi:hypothetical protein
MDLEQSLYETIKRQEKVIADLLAACEDIIKSYDFKMGNKAKKLRIEIMRDVVNKARGE